MRHIFQNRIEAGQLLASVLKNYANKPNVIVLALPRGGVPVGFQIAQKLHAKLDVFLVRKLGVPGHEELAMGAIAWGNIAVLNEELIKVLHISQETINIVREQETQELKRRNRKYRDDLPFPDLQNQIVILVDDGLATGATMHAAVAAIKQLHPAEIVVAIPVAPSDAYNLINPLVDKMVCLEMPEPFYAVGAWYHDFSQTTDEEVQYLLKRSSTFNSEPRNSETGNSNE
jgi:putative phosphoribosyl transferase